MLGVGVENRQSQQAAQHHKQVADTSYLRPEM